MSGFYNNWYKVNHPESVNDIPQMESGGYQKPFYFGGSQVPNTLKTELHEIKEDKYKKDYFLPDSQGKGIQYTSGKKNIHIPRMLFQKQF